MATQPFQLHDISSINELFGRDTLIKHLLIDASLCLNVPIIGARRFGKTCVLKTVQQIIRQKKDLKVYPIYLDFKSNFIQGTELSYNYMISSLVASLYEDRIFTESMLFNKIEIIPSDDWADISEQLVNVSVSRIQSLLEKIVKWFSEYMEKSILFMIDEYEYLFRNALDNSLAFCKIRTMSSDIGNNGEKYFSFWIAGSMPWDELIAEVPGSGEANTVSCPEFVTPIDEESFKKMWEFECAKIKNVTVANYIQTCCKFAFDNSGGVPFYGKDLIGAFIYKNNTLPDFSICNTFFKELTAKAMSCGEYGILKMIAKMPQKIEKSVSRSNLISKGLVKVDAKDKLFIRANYLKEFMVAEMNDIKAMKPQKNEIETVVRRCMDLIETINNQMTNHKKNAIFQPVNDSSSMENDLRTPCYNRDQFSNFTSALYKTYFERTKDGRNQIKNMHKEFFAGKVFSKCVDIARHSFGGHEMDNFNKRENQFGKDELLLTLTSCINEPYTSDEWYKMQVNFLNLFKLELEKMRDYIINNQKRS